eukprot:snap_masked-scaffold_29-processed-gene-2.45-mRNA-1 protein AED:0.08 eAED:0.09 QI:0/0/0/1/1/1/3/0/987
MKRSMVNGVSIKFPFEPYEVQETYMEKVITALDGRSDALLESPTGTGKTLSLLCSTLAWREHQKRLHPRKDPPVIIYCSRTHAQLKQVIKELKRTKYNVKCTVVGARKHLCINKNVVDAKDELRFSCRALTKKGNCGFKNNLLRMSDLPELLTGHDGNDQIMDIEDLKVFGQQRNICPYYFSRHESIQDKVDMVFMPYNYLVDPSSRSGLKIKWQNSIVIIDEAHNLESVCDDSASFSLSSKTFASAADEVDQCLEQLANLSGFHQDPDADAEQVQLSEDELLFVKSFILNLEGVVDSVSFMKTSYGWGCTKEGGSIIDIFSRAGLSTKETVTYLDLLQRIVESHSKAIHIERILSAIEKTYPDALELIGKNSQEKENTLPYGTLETMSLARAQSFFNVYITDEEQKDTSFPTRKKARGGNFLQEQYVHSGFQQEGHQESQGRVLNFWCFSPGVALDGLTKLNVRSVILTSGTLNPLSSFEAQFNRPFPIKLENDHVIEKKQLWLGVVKTGIAGRVLNSNYTMRDTPQYKEELGRSILAYSKLLPQGCLIFFASYYIMNSCINFWKGHGLYQMIEEYKPQFMESRKNLENEEVILEFNRAASNTKGAILYCVCRGKISEGIDFSDEKCRAVIVTGLPYPPTKDPKVCLKQHFLDKMSARKEAGSAMATFGMASRAKVPLITLTGKMWYTQQATKAINQAIGRVIRHRQDFGAIVLMDEKFTYGSAKQGLSQWLRPKFKVCKDFRESSRELEDFFKASGVAPTRAFLPKGFREESSSSGTSFVFNKRTSSARNQSVQEPRRRPNPSTARALRLITPIRQTAGEVQTPIENRKVPGSIFSLFGASASTTVAETTVMRQTSNVDDLVATGSIRKRKEIEPTSNKKTKPGVEAFDQRCKQVLPKSEYRKMTVIVKRLRDLGRQSEAERAGVINNQVKILRKSRTDELLKLDKILVGKHGEELRNSFYKMLPKTLRGIFKEHLLDKYIVILD